MDYAYNGFGELSSQQVAGPQGPLYREGYPERDQLGRLTKRVVGTDPATAVTHGYGYHPQRGWLTQHKLNDSLADAWSYDVRGNRVGKHTGLSGEVTATVDAQDRLVQLGGEALAYDLNGRVVARSGGQLPATYVWDAFGRLREARLNPSQPTEIAVAYGLDPAGRRVRAVAKDASGAVLEDRSWVYDGQLRVIAEVSASGALRARYLYASSGHSPDLAVTFDPDSGAVTGSYLLVHDQVGSVVRTVDLATGVAVESVAYDAWGVATVAPGGSSVHPFGFAGGLWDRRTGLVRFGAREYDAGLGRWLARDPIGFGGGWNQYGYVAGNPVDFSDPSGLANYEHPMQWLPPDADIRAGALLAEQEIAESIRDVVLYTMLGEIAGAVWARPFFRAGPACVPVPKGAAGGERAGKAFTPKGKATVRAENAADHGGKTICVGCGRPTVPAQQGQRGVTPPSNETHVDHIIPKSKGGNGSPDNGQILCRGCNLEKGASLW